MLALPSCATAVGVAVQAGAFGRAPKDSLVVTQALRELVRYRVMRGTETVAGRSLGSSCVQGWFSGALLLVLAGVGYALTTLVAFVVSATNGLFGWQEVWSGTPQAVVGFTELAAVLLLLPALARAAVRSPSRNRGVVRQ